MIIKFDPAAHAELLSSITQSGASLQEILAELDEHGARLRAQWNGEASAAFDAARAAWVESMASVMQALDASSVQARRSAARLTAAESAAEALW